jgi:hypothetical protein
MKMKIEIPESVLICIVEAILVHQYKFDPDDDDLEDKIKLAMSNKKFMADVKKHMRSETEDNLLEKLCNWAHEWSVKSRKHYGME